MHNFQKHGSWNKNKKIFFNYKQNSIWRNTFGLVHNVLNLRNPDIFLILVLFRILCISPNLPSNRVYTVCQLVPSTPHVVSATGRLPYQSFPSIPDSVSDLLQIICDPHNFYPSTKRVGFTFGILIPSSIQHIIVTPPHVWSRVVCHCQNPFFLPNKKQDPHPR